METLETLAGVLVCTRILASSPFYWDDALMETSGFQFPDQRFHR